MAQYKELEKEIQELRGLVENLKRKLHFLDLQVNDAHQILDELDVPKSKSSAFIGHRWHWYKEGKRESYKTKDNTEGYHPDVWKQRQQKLKDIQSGKLIKNDQAGSSSSKLNIVDDGV